MGFGYAGTFLIVFLTHPGVVIPTTKSVTNLLPPEAAAYAPAEGFPPVISGLWQVFCAWVLGLPGEKSAGLAWTMFILYTLFLVFYIYFGVVGTRMAAGV